MEIEPPLRIEQLTRLIIETEVPFENKPSSKNYVVNWADNLSLTEDEIRQSFSKFNKRVNENESDKNKTERKIENTITFYRFVHPHNQ
jgi:hypothetical protein